MVCHIYYSFLCWEIFNNICNVHLEVNLSIVSFNEVIFFIFLKLHFIICYLNFYQILNLLSNWNFDKSWVNSLLFPGTFFPCMWKVVGLIPVQVKPKVFGFSTKHASFSSKRKDCSAQFQNIILGKVTCLPADYSFHELASLKSSNGFHKK